MARAIADIERDIRNLQEEERIALLRVLLEDLDGPADPDVERTWLEEVRCRSRELDSGTVKALPASEVFATDRTEL